ncbi:MAG: pyridoxal phosphate-dependent aminotransferase [Clostridiaceae bacterium]|jgi:aspartate aminotransferase|nr:pyridoxal phosphate-dependent aminotransferase [Clostridiaceae bacterium]
MVSEKILANLKRSSWIRAMFEQGENLRKKYGADNVYDFSLGNPDLEPPQKVKEVLKKTVLSDIPKMHGYMSNAGYADVRAAVAESLRKTKGVPVEASHVVMQCGAGGAMNVVLKTILNPGEEVIVLAPYFAEYLFYIDNHGGIPVIVDTDRETFQPDAEKIHDAITPKTRAIIINSPNNPSGVIYSRRSVESISEVIEKRQKEFGTTICVISDEPYDKIVYDGAEVPSVFEVFRNSVIVNSYSKSLSLPGERIGFVAVNPRIGETSDLVDGLIFSTRTLGFVNAPALFQRILPESLDAQVAVDVYKKRRDMLYEIVTKAGFKCIKPQGAFYLFPQSPIEDDVKFCSEALKYNMIIVPGTGFGFRGFFRLAYCVDEKTIVNSQKAFEALAAEFI